MTDYIIHHIMTTHLTPLIVIAGPTASGKTGLALALATQFGGELINADSRQVYKGMDIATNKLMPGMTKEDISGETTYHADGVPIHLLDLIEPDQEFTLFDYKQRAVEKINAIRDRGRLPILVGGTGLYISAIVDNLLIPPAPADKKLRTRLEEEDAATLFSRLEETDPAAAEVIGQENKRKLIRALEVVETTGLPFSDQKKKGPALFDVLELGPFIDRETLYARIDKRVDEMLASGLLEETQRLRRGYPSELPSMSGIGYKEMTDHLLGRATLEEAAQRMRYRTHQYARRQLTWFKRDDRIHWVKDQEEARKLVGNFIN